MKILWIIPCFLLASCELLSSGGDDDEDVRPTVRETEDSRLIRLRGAIRNDRQWHAAVYDVRDLSIKPEEAVRIVQGKAVCIHDESTLLQFYLEGEFPEKGKEGQRLVRKAYYCPDENVYWIHDRYSESTYNRFYGPFTLKR